jgi:hypothetical protein
MQPDREPGWTRRKLQDSGWSMRIYCSIDRGHLQFVLQLLPRELQTLFKIRIRDRPILVYGPNSVNFIRELHLLCIRHD